MHEHADINRTLDEMLVNLALIVLRVSKPDVTRTPEARHALVLSVNKFLQCAARSTDPRVHWLKNELEESLRPPLRLVMGGLSI